MKMATYNKKSVISTYATIDPQWAWANINGIGWRRIKEGAADGVTNIFLLMNTAESHGRLVNVEIDADNNITNACLI